MTERMTEGRWREIRDSQRREYNRMIAETDPPSWEYDAIEDLAAEAERALAELAAAKAEKNGAYSERNKVVAALAKMFPSGILRDADEAGWWIVFIDLPDGQASWHFHESELDLLVGIPKYEGEWDGHSTEEKYARLKSLHPAYFRFPDARSPEPAP